MQTKTLIFDSSKWWQECIHSAISATRIKKHSMFIITSIFTIN